MIRRFTLKFDEPLEREFQAYGIDARLQPIRAALGLVTVLGSMESFYYIAFVDHGVDGFRAALLGLFALVGLLFRLTYVKAVQSRINLIGGIAVPLVIALVAFQVHNSSPDRRAAIGGIYLLVMLVTTTLPYGHMPKLALNVALFLTCMLLPPTTASPVAAQMVRVHMLFGAAIASILGYAMEKARRSEFLLHTALVKERQRSEDLLRNTLPASVAARLKTKGPDEVLVDKFDEAVVVFADLVGFTPLAASLPAEEIVQLLNDLFSRFDVIAEQHGLEKIKTIGDAYMVVAGVPEAHPNALEAAVETALDIIATVRRMSLLTGKPLEMRVGLHTGPVVAGVIGRNKFLYDLWGDTVNTASRLEFKGEPGRVHMLQAVADRLPPRFKVEGRREVQLKGLGAAQTCFVGSALARPRSPTPPEHPPAGRRGQEPA